MPRRSIGLAAVLLAAVLLSQALYGVYAFVNELWPLLGQIVLTLTAFVLILPDALPVRLRMARSVTDIKAVAERSLGKRAFGRPRPLGRVQAGVKW